MVKLKHNQNKVIYVLCSILGASLVAHLVKSLPAMQKSLVQSLGWEDLLEEGMATHSSILAWEILWTEEPGSVQLRGLHSQT